MQYFDGGVAGNFAEISYYCELAECHLYKTTNGAFFHEPTYLAIRIIYRLTLLDRELRGFRLSSLKPSRQGAK